jgi:periplasmic protein TonB
MMTTARKSFALSLAFHTLMGSLAFLILSQTNQPPKISRIPFKIMSLSPAEHRMAIPIPETTPVPIAQPLTKVVPTPTQPIAKPLIAPTVSPQPIAVQPAPIQTTVQAPPAPKTVAPPQFVIAATAAPAAAPKPDIKPDNTSEKRAFLASLRSTIQHNLRYPSAARRRGMEGEVSVRFTLLAGGNIGDISILSGETIFHTAAKAAVASASGMTLPKSLTDEVPMEINLGLEFKLKS